VQTLLCLPRHCDELVALAVLAARELAADACAKEARIALSKERPTVTQP